MCPIVFPSCESAQKPCRSLCMLVRDKCRDHIQELSGFMQWDCDGYPSFDCIPLSAEPVEVNITLPANITSDCLELSRQQLETNMRDLVSQLDACDTSESALVGANIHVTVVSKRILSVQITAKGSIDCAFAVGSSLNQSAHSLTNDAQMWNCTMSPILLPIRVQPGSTPPSTARHKRRSNHLQSSSNHHSSINNATCTGHIIELISSDIYASAGETVELICQLRKECSKQFSVSIDSFPIIHHHQG